MNFTRVGAVGIAFTFGVNGFARLSPAWIDAPAYEPNVRVLIHDSSLAAKTSTITVQKPRKGDARVAALMAKLKATQTPDPDLYPHQCYGLNRKDLVSRQTWCVSSTGETYAFIEIGPEKMSSSEFLQVQLEALQGKPSAGPARK